MTVVSISPKFQVVIPQDIRKSLDIEVGMKCEVVAYGEKIVFIPLRPIGQMKGVLQGIDTTIIRHKDRL